jgi:hypothetical protein
VDSATQTAVNSLSGSLPIILVELDHPNLAEPIRFAQNTENIVSNSNTYTAAGFDMQLPSMPEGGYPLASISADNVPGWAMDYINETNGGAGSTLRIMQVMADSPNTIQYDITLYVSEIHITRKTLTAKLGFEYLLGLPLTRWRYTPQKAPGLFANV